MKLLLIIFFHLALVSGAFAKVEIVLGNVPLNQNTNLLETIPSTDNPEIIISKDQYVISYNKTRRAPNWVAWKLEANQMGHTGRTNNFAQDAELEHYLTLSSSGQHAVTPAEFKGSCFDRGHQVPSADRTSTPEDNQATFLMSNMIPQTPYLNRVIWEHLEQYTRDLVLTQGKKVYIIAGPIYDEDFGAIGPLNDIPVPSKDFKVILVLDANQTPSDIDQNTPVIAVVMPNTLQDGSKPLVNKGNLCNSALVEKGSADDWQKYKTTVSAIEKMSGISISQVPH